MADKMLDAALRDRDVVIAFLMDALKGVLQEDPKAAVDALLSARDHFEHHIVDEKLMALLDGSEDAE